MGPRGFQEAIGWLTLVGDRLAKVHQSRRLVCTARPGARDCNRPMAIIRVPLRLREQRFVPLRLREQRFAVKPEFFDTFADVIEGPVAASFARSPLEDLGIPASS